MEPVVREIVARLGLDVATKKLVCREYCKVMNVEKLSSLEKTKIQQVLGCIVDEIAANPETPIGKLDASLPPTSNTNSSDSVANGYDDNQDENIEINDSDVNKYIHNEYLSSIKDLLLKPTNNKDITVEKISSPARRKKRGLKRIRSKDVLDSVLDSNDENSLGSPKKSPKKLKRIEDDIIYEEFRPTNLIPSKKTCGEVLDSLLESDNDEDVNVSIKERLSSRETSPTKSLDDGNASVCDSPLFTPKSSSKSMRKNLLSDSESDDDDEEDIRVNRTSSKSSPVKPVGRIAKLKKRCAELDSDSDSENNFCDDIPHKLTALKAKSKKNYTDVKNCKVILEDCALNSDYGLGNRTSIKTSGKKRFSPVESNGKRKQERSLSSSGDDLDSVTSSSASESEDERLEQSSNKSEAVNASKTTKSDLNGMSKDTKESLIADVSSEEDSSDGKKKGKAKHDKKQSKKAESKHLKDLRAICRHVGVILRNTIELQGCETDEEKVQRIKSILRDKGMKGRPSMKSAIQFNLERELKELGGVSTDAGSKTPTKGSRRRACRDGAFSLKNSSPVVAASDDFSHMKDIFCADDSSD